MDIPGYSLAKHFQLEVAIDNRPDLEKIILSTNSFNLPELSSQTFDMVWGPGFPKQTFPGPPDYSPLSLEVTDFYELELVQFFVEWHEGALIDILNNRKDGYIIGYDDDKEVVYEAQVKGLWPTTVSLGNMSRDASRRVLSMTLAYQDVIHQF